MSEPKTPLPDEQTSTRSVPEVWSVTGPDEAPYLMTNSREPPFSGPHTAVFNGGKFFNRWYMHIPRNLSSRQMSNAQKNISDCCDFEWDWGNENDERARVRVAPSTEQWQETINFYQQQRKDADAWEALFGPEPELDGEIVNSPPRVPVWDKWPIKPFTKTKALDETLLRNGNDWEHVVDDNDLPRFIDLNHNKLPNQGRDEWDSNRESAFAFLMDREGSLSVVEYSSADSGPIPVDWDDIGRRREKWLKQREANRTLSTGEILSDDKNVSPFPEPPRGYIGTTISLSGSGPSNASTVSLPQDSDGDGVPHAYLNTGYRGKARDSASDGRSANSGSTSLSVGMGDGSDFDDEEFGTIIDLTATEGSNTNLQIPAMMLGSEHENNYSDQVPKSVQPAARNDAEDWEDVMSDEDNDFGAEGMQASYVEDDSGIMISASSPYAPVSSPHYGPDRASEVTPSPELEDIYESGGGAEQLELNYRSDSLQRGVTETRSKTTPERTTVIKAVSPQVEGDSALDIEYDRSELVNFQEIVTGRSLGKATYKLPSYREKVQAYRQPQDKPEEKIYQARTPRRIVC
ncbi:hypothetical protein BCR34DRAFT_304968 [Clohesyomyces aquaticus]|uniref:Uncharacterized protein n=1 Tax=Clohesyomyces aquaticus TaxID=1231657 RepID=A0A1Y1ZPM4_9PLEO|nr:hypothetical protein BCR34DRAFT_304968 [Clohesyomyces aquaticus]